MLLCLSEGCINRSLPVKITGAFPIMSQLGKRVERQTIISYHGSSQLSMSMCHLGIDTTQKGFYPLFEERQKIHARQRERATGDGNVKKKEREERIEKAVGVRREG